MLYSEAVQLLKNLDLLSIDKDSLSLRLVVCLHLGSATTWLSLITSLHTPPSEKRDVGSGDETILHVGRPRLKSGCGYITRSNFAVRLTGQFGCG